jgi:TonB family protein
VSLPNTKQGTATMVSPSSNRPPAPVPSSAVAVLSSDSDLLAAARRASGAEHELLTVATETELAAQLVNGRAGAVLIDGAALQEPIDTFTERLKKQFPDLVLVVAGGPEDQSRLSKQITNGVVYRFLHRPVSEQRIRLFLEAALRRHDVEHAEQAQTIAAPKAPARPATSQPGGSKSNTLLLGAGAAIAVLAAIGIWFATRGEPETAATQPAAAAQPTTQAQRVAALLAEAEGAFARGEWVAPAGSSAADKYRAALVLDPNNSRARTGIDLVLDKLLGEAESALLGESIDVAEERVTAATALSPGNARAAFLAVQVRKERERGALARARDNARATGNEQVAGFLRLANQRLRSGNLIEPAEDNARFFIEAARGVAPEDPAVARLTRSLQSALLDQARQAAASGSTSEAEMWLANAEESAASRATIAEIRRTLQQNQITARADSITRLTQSFNQALTADRFVGTGDSAKAYMLQLASTDATHPATAEARRDLGAELLREARIALGRSDLQATNDWLQHASDIGFASTELDGVRRDLATARNRAAGAPVTDAPVANAASAPARAPAVSASTLERVTFVEPRFPEAGRGLQSGGYVDIEFTVMTNGSVADVTAVGAQPVGVFEQSAISAVRRWRYRPVVRDGVPVEQRAKVRLRFELKE